MKIYLDTNLWNISFDQKINPQSLLSDLTAKNSALVLSQQTIYELAKTFRAETPPAYERGQSLFAHLNLYTNSGRPLVAKDVANLLVAEMQDLNGNIAEGNKFLQAEDLTKIQDEITRLARGEISSELKAYIEDRIGSAEKNRREQRTQLDSDEELTQTLRSIPEAQFEGWLKTELRTQTAKILLTQQIGAHFPDVSTIELLDWAEALLKAEESKISKGLVGASYYYNWRCAHRGSNRSDLLDDMYHVLNATYCDVYATDEKKQIDYASYLLPAGSKSKYMIEITCVWMIGSSTLGIEDLTNQMWVAGGTGGPPYQG